MAGARVPLRRLASFWIVVIIAAGLLVNGLAGIGVNSTPRSGLAWLTLLYLPALFATLISGLLIYILLLVVFVEALVRRIPRVFAALPVLVVAAYEVEAFRQHLGVISVERSLQARNVETIPFDPAKVALVFSDRRRALELLQTYALPATYVENDDHSFTTLTLATQADCAAVASPDRDAPFVKDLNFPLSLVFCIGQNKTSIVGDRLDVGPADRLGRLEELDGRRLYAPETIAFVRNGQRQGTFTTAGIELWPYLPQILVGCGANDNAARWQCGAVIVPEHVYLDALSGPGDSRAGDPLPAILALTSRTPEEIAARGWPTGQKTAG